MNNNFKDELINAELYGETEEERQLAKLGFLKYNPDTAIDAHIWKKYDLNNAEDLMGGNWIGNAWFARGNDPTNDNAYEKLLNWGLSNGYTGIPIQISKHYEYKWGDHLFRSFVIFPNGPTYQQYITEKGVANPFTNLTNH